jgi:hypothetical protein
MESVDVMICPAPSEPKLEDSPADAALVSPPHQEPGAGTRKPRQRRSSAQTKTPESSPRPRRRTPSRSANTKTAQPGAPSRRKRAAQADTDSLPRPALLFQPEPMQLGPVDLTSPPDATTQANTTPATELVIRENLVPPGDRRLSGDLMSPAHPGAPTEPQRPQDLEGHPPDAKAETAQPRTKRRKRSGTAGGTGGREPQASQPAPATPSGPAANEKAGRESEAAPQPPTEPASLPTSLVSGAERQRLQAVMEHLLDSARPVLPAVPESQATEVQPSTENTPAPARADRTNPSRPPVKFPGREELALELQTKQNFRAAVIAGAAAATLGVLLWTALAFLSDSHVGWMAIGAGLLIGGAVRRRGQGLERSFSHLAVGLTTGSCLLGHVLSSCVVGAGGALSPLNLLFCGIAIYATDRLSCRRLTEWEMDCIIYAGVQPTAPEDLG